MRRNELTQQIDILDTLKQPLLISHLTSKTRITHSKAIFLLKKMQENNLITKIESKKSKSHKKSSRNCHSTQTFYVTTEQGKQILAVFKTVKNALE